MKKQEILKYLLENDKDSYYDEKKNKLYITTRLYDDINLIINNSLCMRDMVKSLQYKYAIINEKLAYKLINGVRLGYKNLEVL